MERSYFKRLAERLGAKRGRRGAMQLGGVGCAAVLGLFHLFFPFSIGVVQGSSMVPTYRPGQFFLLDRHYYQDHPIRRGDVVVVRCDDHTMIKRVFAVGGDALWLLIQPDQDRVDRYIVDADSLARLRRATVRCDIGRLTHLKVPPGTVYLLGDCVEASIDSRAFGAVPTSAILGRVVPWRPGVGSPVVKRVGA